MKISPQLSEGNVSNAHFTYFFVPVFPVHLIEQTLIYCNTHYFLGEKKEREKEKERERKREFFPKVSFLL